jgi:hypothetical protein
MARQVDFVEVRLMVRRKSDGTYDKLLVGVNASASDPTAALEIDQGPFTGFPIGLTYQASPTVDAYLDTALALAKTAAGAP